MLSSFVVQVTANNLQLLTDDGPSQTLVLSSTCTVYALRFMVYLYQTPPASLTWVNVAPRHIYNH